MENTIIQQGRFTSDGTTKTLAIRSDVDWIRVYNETAAAQGAADLASVFYFQRGMTSGRGLVWTKLGTVANDPVTIGQIAADGGFILVDQGSDAAISGATAITGVTNATNPVVATGDTGNLVSGDIIRLSQTAAQRTTADATTVLGIDFQIDNVTANTNFRIRGALATAIGGGAAAAAGSWRKVSLDGFYSPKHRFVCNISQAASAVVTTTVDHGYAVGQEVKFIVDNSLFGMTEIDGLKGTITATAASTITVDIDSSGFTAFTWPTQALAAGQTYTPAMVVPVGMDTSQAISSSVDILSDATDNTTLVGVDLVGGAAGPGGAAADVMYWVAGKSFSVTNE